MKDRRLFWAAILVLIALGVGYFARSKSPTKSPVTSSQPGTVTSPKSPTAALPADAVPQVATGASAEDATFEGIEKLNARNFTVQDDLRLLNDLFFSWQATFPHGGNPVGSNQEIAAAFTGTNKFNLALIPKNHPALNPAGELVDRWGTPYFFHQLSGSRMEIRSAGPDRQLHTNDDAVHTP